MSELNESALQLLCSSTRIVVATSATLDSIPDQIDSVYAYDDTVTASASWRDAKSESPLEDDPVVKKHALVKSKSLDFDMDESCEIIDSMSLSPGRFLTPSLSLGHSLSTSDTNLPEKKPPTMDTLSKMRKSSEKASKYPLHFPKNVQSLISALRVQSVNPNSMTDLDMAPLHAIISNKRKDRTELLQALLVHSQADIDLCTADGNTGLHLAILEGKEFLIKTLLGFGAKLNLMNAYEETPLDIALTRKKHKHVNLLLSCGATTRDLMRGTKKLPRLRSFHSIPASPCPVPARDRVASELCRSLNSRGGTQRCGSVSLKEMQDGATLVSLPDRIKQCINFKLEQSGSFSINTDEDVAIIMQQRELKKFNKTAGLGISLDSCNFSIRGGSRILFLDGGGIRGLIQIEILRKLEEETGRKITELFDWIVGTSTGGIIALGLVYARKSLTELRQLYFKLKDKVFAHDRMGFAYNTDALETILKEEFGVRRVMSDVHYPRVLIGAVYKKTTVPELHFFNNCFHDEFSTQLVWKVARYTSAAPMFFTEFENYVDGGVLANNPSESGFSAIQNYFRQQGTKLNVALVVSIGCGVYPAETLGKVDAQQFLFFGKHWLKAGYEIRKRAKNLLSLLTTALVDSENVAKNTKSRMAELQIPFYRFSPHLDEAIPSGETDMAKLLDMLLKARMDTEARYMEDLIQTLYMISEMSRSSQ